MSFGWPEHLFEQKAIDFQAVEPTDLSVTSDIDGLTFLSLAGNLKWIKPVLPVILHMDGTRITYPLKEIKGLANFFDKVGLNSIAYRISFIRDLPIFMGITWVEENDIDWSSMFKAYMFKNIFLPAIHMLPTDAITYKTYIGYKDDNIAGLPNMLKIYSDDWLSFSENIAVLVEEEKRRPDSLLHMCEDVIFFTSIHGMKQHVPDLNFVDYMLDAINFECVQFKSLHICNEIKSESQSVLSFTRKFLKKGFGQNAALYPVFGSYEFANMTLNKMPISIYETYGHTIDWKDYSLHYIQAYQNANKTVSGIGINTLFNGAPASQIMRMYGEHLRYKLENNIKFKQGISPVLQHSDFKRAIHWAKDMVNGTSVRFEIVLQIHSSDIAKAIGIFTDISHLSNFLQFYACDTNPIVEIDAYFVSKYLINTIESLYAPVMLSIDRINRNISTGIHRVTQDVSADDIITTLFAESCINFLIYGQRKLLPNKLLLSEGIGITKIASSYKYNRIVINERHWIPNESTYHIGDLYLDSRQGYHEYVSGTLDCKFNTQRRISQYLLKLMEIMPEHNTSFNIKEICPHLILVLQHDIYEGGSKSNNMYLNPAQATSRSILRNPAARETGSVRFKDYIYRLICGTLHAEMIFPLSFAFPSCIEKTMLLLRPRSEMIDLPDVLSTEMDCVNRVNCEHNIQPCITVIPRPGCKHVVTKWSVFNTVEGSTPIDKIQDEALHE